MFFQLSNQPYFPFESLSELIETCKWLVNAGYTKIVHKLLNTQKTISDDELIMIFEKMKEAYALKNHNENELNQIFK